MKLPLIYIFYFLLALLVGIIFSFGYVGIFQQHEPLQVQLEQYQPINPPAPAVPTIAPVVQATGAFAPASAPQVIPTQVLPSVTPISYELYTAGNCNSDSSKTNIACVMQQISGNISSAFSILGTLLFVLGLVVIISSFIRGSSIEILLSGFSMIIAGAIFFVIGTIVLNTIMSSLPATMMSP